MGRLLTYQDTSIQCLEGSQGNFFNHLNVGRCGTGIAMVHEHLEHNSDQWGRLHSHLLKQSLSLGYIFHLSRQLVEQRH